MIVVPEVARPFAELQMGQLDQYRGSPAWIQCVDALARERFETIKPFLPASCRRMADIGGGVAASDVPILDYYDPAPDLWVLDGDEGKRRVERHDKPFNSMSATAALLEANGHWLTGFWTPEPPSEWGGPKFDLVVSFASWGFHFEPAEYLDFVSSISAPGARIILDLRKGKSEWRESLDRSFGFIGVAFSSLKFDRVVYERRDHLDPGRRMVSRANR